jgi:SWI/SNF-related matrix-associated actin-dependent regulator 1 of chromatin subfamily A
MTSKHPILSERLLPPSQEVCGEALARAERLARGLYSHQVEGVAFLLARRRAILADDMGLGKTRQSIVALVEAAPDGPWLVVCPASVKQNWAREIEAAQPGSDVHVVGSDAPPIAGHSGWTVINYDVLSKHEDALRDADWQGLVFDEAHYIKNHQSKRSKLARSLVDGQPNAVVHCLTGTPLTNRPRDLFPLLQLVGHPMARSFLSFAKRYCAATQNDFGWITDGASNLQELRLELHGVMLRRTKDEALDLPPKLRSWLRVDVPDTTARRETRLVFDQLMRVTSSPPTTNGAGRRRAPGADRARLLASLTRARLAISKAKVKGTIEHVENALEQGQKVLVFTSFDEPANKIAQHFGKRAVQLTGKTPQKQRQRLVDRFQDEPGVQVFVANLIAGGVGINLTAARQVVFNDLDWVPANHWQAEDRAYRIGQTNTVHVAYMVAKGTVDEFVHNALETKAALVQAVVEGTRDDAPGGDLLQLLEHMVQKLSPGIATPDDRDDGDLDRWLRSIADAVQGEVGDPASSEVPAALRKLPQEALMALAQVLAGPKAREYSAASSSDPSKRYTLHEEDGDVTCSCPGFEYRGTCSHARKLKAALAAGDSLPAGFTVAEGGAR